MNSASEVERTALCPFREETAEEGILCFDPWLDEYAKPPDEVVVRWCEKDFSTCPTYLAFQRSLALRR